MERVDLDGELRAEVVEIADSCGCELLECEFKGGVLRLVIDRSGGVSLDDCQSVSKQVSALLDVADFGVGKYVLEVSSPGLDRKLYGEKDYERFTGRQVRITWKTSEMLRTRTVVARLEGYSAQRREIVLVVPEADQWITLALDDVVMGRLAPEF